MSINHINSELNNNVYYDNKNNHYVEILNLKDKIKNNDWQTTLPQLIELIPKLDNKICKTNALNLLQQIEKLLKKDRSVANKDPEYVTLANQYIEHEMWSDAKRCLDKVEETNVDSQLIFIFEKKGEDTQLTEYVNKLEQAPQNLLSMAESCIKKGNLKVAITLANKIDFLKEEDKINFYGVLACNIILTDYLDTTGHFFVDFSSRANEVVENAFSDELALSKVKQKVISSLKDFPNIVASEKLKQSDLNEEAPYGLDNVPMRLASFLEKSK